MQMQQPGFAVSAQQDVAVRALLHRVYLWMASGLALTAVTAWIVASSPALVEIFLLNRMVFYACLGVELLMVIAFTAIINRVNLGVGLLLFLAYAVVNGLTMSFIFLVYTASSIAGTFAATALTFGAMSAFGFLTKMDLSRFGSYLLMALVGMIIGSVVNIFLASGPLHWALTYLGIFVFIGLTAYDTQKIKSWAQSEGLSEDHRQRLALLGALTLYLDFINLFLLLLRLFGRRR